MSLGLGIGNKPSFGQVQLAEATNLSSAAYQEIALNNSWHLSETSCNVAVRTRIIALPDPGLLIAVLLASHLSISFIPRGGSHSPFLFANDSELAAA